MNAQIAITPRERLVEALEWLEAGTPMKAGVSEFNMHRWVEKNECGTTACLGGTIVQFDQAARGQKPIACGDLCEIDAELTNTYSDIGDYAGDLCGLSPIEANTLFRENLDATPAEAATTIRRYLSDGRLYWDYDGENDSESDALIRSRQFPTKNSVLLGADGKPITESGSNVVAVLNTVTGTVRAWKPFGNKQFRHQYAVASASALLQLPGYTPWDLSSKVDLEAILASSKSAVFDTDQYPDLLEEWHWAKDTYDGTSSAGCAWVVDFLTGNVGYGNRDLLYRALAVCRPVPASQ